MSNLRLEIESEKFPIKGAFTIARGSKTEASVVTVRLAQGAFSGRGECVPYARYGESVDSVVRQIENVREQIEPGVDNVRLQELMPAGAARNAVDCALWDLQAKRTGISARERAGISSWEPVTTAFTISLGTPEEMAVGAKGAADRPILKIKLGGEGGDVDRIRAVRRAVPRATLIADANEGWTAANLESHFRACAEAGFALIEQPVPADQDEVLRDVVKSVPLCADESLHDRAGLERLRGLYQYINIKLDKTGGLTEALALADSARARGFGIMVGCMVATSLAMAPAMLIAMNADFVDLDGPLLLARDRGNGLGFDGSLVHPPSPALWG